jgi:hypothetical protein
VLQVTCLNEQSEGSCRSVFKAWDQRTCFSSEPLTSCLDDDAELLLHIPCALNLCLDHSTWPRLDQTAHMWRQELVDLWHYVTVSAPHSPRGC